MQEYFYIQEQLENLQIEEKLNKLSKQFEGKKVVLFGANNALEAVCSKYDLKTYFNVVGICDNNINIMNNANIFEQDDFKMISVQNLYFSGVNVIVNLKEDGAEIEKYLRKNHLIKKKVQFINLLDKSLVTKLIDAYEILKMSICTFKKTKQIVPILKDIINYKSDDIVSRLNYESKISEIIERKDNPIRVLFTVFDYNQWFLSKLFYSMRADSDFKVLPIVVLPNELKSDNLATEETIKYFNAQGIECIDGIEHDTNEAVMIKALKPDLIIYQQPPFLKNDYTPTKLSEIALTCFVEPNFEVRKTEHFNSFIKDRLNNTWQIYSANQYSLKPFKNVETSGFTLYEKYRQVENPSTENLWNVPSSVENNRIVYVPSFVINETFNVAKFKEQQTFMYDYIATHPQYSFVVIPDMKYKQQCLDNKIMTEEEYNNYFIKLNALPNVNLSEYVSAIDIFKTSNVLITDSLTSAINYFPSGKPIIFINNTHKDIVFNEIGEKIYKTFYKLSSKDAIDIVLEDLLLAQNDYNFKNRYSILGKYSEYFNNEATDFIINDLKNKLGKNQEAEIQQPENESVVENIENVEEISPENEDKD